MVAKTVEEAITLIEQNKVHILSLGHDLGVEEEANIIPTGSGLIKYVCEQRMRPANKIYIH